MIRGLYTSAWSMMANSKMMDVISNNLANVNTNGYKKDTVAFETFPDVLAKRVNDTGSAASPTGNIGSMQLGSDVGEIYTNYKQAQLTKTGGNLDMALKDSDSAFFTVRGVDANGQQKEYYTRDGSFTLDPNNRLVTGEGYSVLGQNGPITLKGGEFTVKEDGSIVQNGAVVDKLQIKQFTDTKTLRKYGENMVERTNESTEQGFTGTVEQGFIEQSNVNTVKEMVDMINVVRCYETSQKLIQMQDSTLEKAVNEVGSVR